MVEKRVMTESERQAIIFGIVGSVLAILVIIGIAINMGLYLKNKKKKKNHRTSVHASSHQNEGMSKRMYILAYITLAFFILTPISQTFLRCNFVSGKSFEPYNICGFAYFMYYFPYSMGQFSISTFLLYRLHVTFFKSQYKIKRRTNIIIATVFGILSLLFVSILLFSKKVFIDITTADKEYRYCSNVNDDTLNYLGWLGGFAAQTLYNIYVLYAFIWRLYKIRKNMLNSFMSERSKTHEPSICDIQSYKRILKLNRLMIKMCFLVILSILFTWFYLFVGIISVDIAYAASYSIIIDTVCMWLLFSSITDKYWNKLVKIFYFPCLCFIICPSIKKDNDNDIKHLKHLQNNTDITQMKEETVASNTKTITENNDDDDHDDHDDDHVSD